MSKLLLLVLGLSTVASAQKITLFDIGQKLNDGMLRYIPLQRCLTAPSQVDPCIRVRLRGVVYTVGYRAKDKRVDYVETHDAAFMTQAGLRVGSLVEGPVGNLTWADDFGEVVGPETIDGWAPIVAHSARLECADGTTVTLGAEQPRNLAPCSVWVMGFKKRPSQPNGGSELSTLGDSGVK
jgi:hypothetical protein